MLLILATKSNCVVCARGISLELCGWKVTQLNIVANFQKHCTVCYSAKKYGTSFFTKLIFIYKMNSTRKSNSSERLSILFYFFSEDGAPTFVAFQPAAISVGSAPDKLHKINKKRNNGKLHRKNILLHLCLCQRETTTFVASHPLQSYGNSVYNNFNVI